jgi:hypothetical protein
MPLSPIDQSRQDRPTPGPSKKRKAGGKSGKKAAAAPSLPVSDWMTPAECAAYRNISLSCLNKERIRGDGPPYIKIRSRLVRYSRRAVDTWNEERTRRSTSDVPSGNGD